MHGFSQFATAAMLSLASFTRAAPQSVISEARYDIVNNNQQPAFSTFPDFSEYTSEFIDSAIKSFANDYLQAHNSFRAQHGARALTWSPALAVKAQNWANRCEFKHGSTGENLAAGTGNYDALDAVKGWTDEISKLLDRQPSPEYST
jgi:hypothetical protein